MGGRYGCDEPSCDGDYNIEYKCSTWFSPCELYDKDNKYDDIIYTGYDFMYDNGVWPITHHERRNDFRHSDLEEWGHN